MANTPQLPAQSSNYSTSPTAPTIYYASTDIVMAHFSEDELDSISSSNAPISLGFFCLCAGVFASFLGVLLSSDIKDPAKHATCLALTVSSGIMALYFLYRHFADAKEMTKKLGSLKRRFGIKPQASQ